MLRTLLDYLKRLKNLANKRGYSYSNLKLCAFADESDASIDLQIEALKRNSIPYLEIHNVDGVNISKITLEKAKEIKSKLDANGLAVWSLGSPYGKIKVADDFAPIWIYLNMVLPFTIVCTFLHGLTRTF